MTEARQARFHSPKEEGALSCDSFPKSNFTQEDPMDLAFQGRNGVS